MSKYWIYMLVCLLLGGFGIHEFYVKNNLGGILSILFCWTYIPCAVALIKFIVWLCRGEDEWNAKYLAVVESGTTGSKSNTTDSSENRG